MTTTKTKPTFDQAAVVQMAARLFEATMTAPLGATKLPSYHARRALAVATAFAEIVAADDFARTSAERFAEIE